MTKNKTSLDEITQEIKRYLGNSATNKIKVGFLLEPISKDSLWKEGEYKSFEHLTFTEFNLGKSAAYQYISVSKRFGKYILDEELEPVNHKRLIRLLKYATDENADELAQEACVLSQTDFENQMKMREGKPVSDDHDHELELSHEVYQCKRCDFKQKVKKNEKN